MHCRIPAGEPGPIPSQGHLAEDKPEVMLTGFERHRMIARVFDMRVRDGKHDGNAMHEELCSKTPLKGGNFAVSFTTLGHRGWRCLDYAKRQIRETMDKFLSMPQTSTRTATRGSLSFLAWAKLNPQSP